MRDHFDALDFDLFDRWRVRLRDVPLSIGWGAVALFIRHLPRDSETAREIEPRTAWSDETYLLAAVHDLIGDLFAKEYKHLERPGTVPRFSTAEQVDESELDQLLSLFRKEGGANG